jgi:hypothetical protein
MGLGEGSKFQKAESPVFEFECRDDALMSSFEESQLFFLF